MSWSDNLIFDFGTDTWSTGASPPYRGDHYAAITVGTKIFLVGSLEWNSRVQM